MNKKPMIIVGAFFALIIIALTVYLILTLTTDIFKPKKEIFQSYLKKNTELINECTDISKEEEYFDILKQKNYRDNATIKLNYTNSSNKVENFVLTSNGIINNSDNNSYRKINLNYGKDYTVIDAEYLQENQTYGLLLSNVVRQFIAADIDKPETFFNTIGININKIKKHNFFELINILKKDKEKIENTIIKYIDEMSEGSFSKKSEVQVTLNNGDTQIATAFIAELTSEQTKELYLNLLEDFDQQEEINIINNSKRQFPRLQIVFYVLNDETIRATIETDNDQVRIDFYEKQLNIRYNNITENEIKTINLDVKRGEEQGTTISYKDSYNNKVDVKYNINVDVNKGSSNIHLSFQNDYVKNIEMESEQKMEFSNTTIQGIEKKFENQKVVNITKLKSSDISSSLDGWLKKIDNVLLNKNNQINSELINIWVNINKDLENSYNDNEAKLKKEFNNQFLVYQGDKVEKNIIYNLIDLLEINMENYEEIGEDSFKVYISQGTKNVKLAGDIKSKIEKSRKIFSINFGYNSEGKINTVEIRGYDERN